MHLQKFTTKLSIEFLLKLPQKYKLATLLTGSNRWQLDLKNEKVTSLSLGRGTLINK